MTIAGVAAVLAVVVALVILRGRLEDASDAIIASRVVVAPLENRTGLPELDPVGRMVAEWVTQGLLRTGLVQVVDAQTMLATARGGDRPGRSDYLRNIADRTGAGTVVGGSYFLEGDRIRFLVHITRAPSGELRHSVDVVDAPIARPTVALDPLRQRITGALAVLLDARLNNWSARASQPPTYEAYAEFLLGMETVGTDYANSARHFARAAELDSNYWQAKLWAAMTYTNIRRYPPADSLFRILDRNRSKLAPYDEANLDYFYGGFVRGDWETSYRGARRMLALAPGAAHALYAAGFTAQVTNRFQESLDLLAQIDTRQGWGQSWAARIYNLMARSYHQLGDHENDLRWARKMRLTEPNAGWARLREVQALAGLGRGREALQLATEGASFPASDEGWEEYSPGDFLRQAGIELRGWFPLNPRSNGAPAIRKPTRTVPPCIFPVYAGSPSSGVKVAVDPESVYVPSSVRSKVIEFSFPL